MKLHGKEKFRYLNPFLIALITSLIFYPKYGDPLNPIKMLTLLIFSIYTLDLLISKNYLKERLKLKTTKLILIILIFFTLSQISAYIFTDNKVTALIGFSGRNNGLISYLTLAVIMVYVLLTYSSYNLHKTYKIIIFSSIIFLLYGLTQYFKIDPVTWNTPYNKIVLTVGNPNFSAALFGILISILFAYLIYVESVLNKLLLSLLLVGMLVITFATDSRQGLITSALGIGFTLTVKAWETNKKIGKAFIIVGTTSLALTILGMLQKGPLTKLLYKDSIRDRGYNWRAAWHMFESHPVFGVGLDRYAAYFPQYKDSKYALIYGYVQSVNNSHNVFLQLLATGGIFVFIFFVSLTIFIGWRAILIIKLTHGKQRILNSGMVAGWLSYLAQSFISIDNLSISIWGWILGGTIVAISMDSKIPLKEGYVERMKGQSSRPNIFRWFYAIFSLVLLIYIALPINLAESRYFNFQKLTFPDTLEGKKEVLQFADKTFNTPMISADYKMHIAVAVTNLGFESQGIRYFRNILANDPRRFDAHEYLAQIYERNKSFDAAIEQRKLSAKLNPFGADSLVELIKDYLAVGNKTAAASVRDAILKMAPGTEVAKQAKELLTK